MKCFYHLEREAVATCQKCGKGLCRECAEKYIPCMCDTCAVMAKQSAQAAEQSKEEQRKQKYRDALVDTRGEFIKTALIGVVVGIAFIWWTASQENYDYSFFDYVGIFFGVFCIPFGWKFLTYLQSFIPMYLFGTFWFWFFYIAVKAFASLLVGIPAFIYQLVKTIMAQRRINDLK